MKKSSTIYLLTALLVVTAAVSVFMYSCEKEEITPMNTSSQNTIKAEGDPEIKIPEELCGKVTKRDILNPNGRVVGKSYIFNTDKNFYVYLVAERGFELGSAFMQVTKDHEKIPMNSEGNPDPGKFQHIVKQEGGVMREMIVPVSLLHEQSVAAIMVEMRMKDTGSNWFNTWVDGKQFGAGILGRAFIYKEQKCTVEPVEPLEPEADLQDE